MDITQDPLFGTRTTTGAEHPDTSVEAALAAAPRAGTQRYTVLALLCAGPRTDEEMQHLLHISPNAQRPRRGELVRCGLVRATDQRRRTDSGNWACVWEVTPAGRLAYLEARTTDAARPLP